MRLGTTSYIWPADMLTNVRKLVEIVDDIELLFFEVDDSWNRLPDRSVIREIASLGLENDVSYSVHLPLDLRLSSDVARIRVVEQVLEVTGPLNPHSYIVHLDSDGDSSSEGFQRWLENSVRSLEAVSELAGDKQKICVENLDGQSPFILDAVLDQISVSCCIDVGHLWKQGLDPLRFIGKWLPSAGVVHLHGVDGNDHKSLSVMSVGDIYPVIAYLNKHFDGVLTLEVFREKDFRDSLEVYEGVPRNLGDKV